MGYHARRMLRLAPGEIGELWWGTNGLSWVLDERGAFTQVGQASAEAALLGAGESFPGQLDAEAPVWRVIQGRFSKGHPAGIAA